MNKTIAMGLALVLMSTSARADTRSESHAALTTLAHWGMCLVSKNGETSAKAQVYSVVSQIDEAFERKHGVKATDVARQRFGEDFVTHYYTMAKADHDSKPSSAARCSRLGQRVIDLSK